MMNDYEISEKTMLLFTIEDEKIYVEYAKRFGMTSTMLFIMEKIYCETNEISQQDICVAFLLPKQTVSSIVKKLIEKEYITQTPQNSYKNKKILKLTEKGRDFCILSIEPLLQVEKSAFYSLTEEERKIYLKTYRKIIDYKEEKLKFSKEKK